MGGNCGELEQAVKIDSDLMNAEETVEWTMKWVDLTIPKIKDSGSLYIFTTWRHSPEIFSLIKKKMTMLNEIVWDRRVPSMGGSTRKFSSVHDTIGFFVKSKNYYFDLDSVRVPYDPETKKARTRNLSQDLFSLSAIRLLRTRKENFDCVVNSIWFYI